MFIRDASDFEKRSKELKKAYTIQGVHHRRPALHPLFLFAARRRLEIMSMDRRYETNVDSLGRIPAAAQEGMDVSPSYVVVGNQPVSLRESMLAEALRMGENVVRVSKEIAGPKDSSVRSASSRSLRPICISTAWRSRRESSREPTSLSTDRRIRTSTTPNRCRPAGASLGKSRTHF
jgi:hypothetical protein